MKASAHFYLGQYRAAHGAVGRRALHCCRRTPIPSWWCPRCTTSRSRVPRRDATGRRRSGSARALAPGARPPPSPRAPLYLSNLACLQILIGRHGRSAARRRGGTGGRAAVREPRPGGHVRRGAGRVPARSPGIPMGRSPAEARRGAPRPAAHGGHHRRPARRPRPRLLRARPVPARGGVPERGRGARERPAGLAAAHLVPRAARHGASCAPARARRAPPAHRSCCPSWSGARTTTSACASTGGSPSRCSRSASGARADPH